MPASISDSDETDLKNILDAALQHSRQKDCGHLMNYMGPSLIVMAISLTGGDVPDDFFSFDHRNGTD
jgi:hypothetical protein